MEDSYEVLPTGFEETLASVGGLEPELAKVYALGLARVVITTRDVARHLGCPQNTAGHHLNRLVDLGYFVVTPASPSGGGFGTGRRFRVVSPRTALSRRFDAFASFSERVGLIEEHLEVQAANDGPSDEIWKISSRLVARQVIQACLSARHSIRIASNDVSWLDVPGALESLSAARGRRVRVEVLAGAAAGIRRRRLREKGILVRTLHGGGPVFMLIDDRALYLPFREGAITSRYSALFTMNEYLVRSHLELFRTLMEVTKR